MLEIELFWRLKCVLNLYWIIWNKTVWHLTLCIAHSAGTVKYTDCTSAEGKTTPVSVLDMTLDILMVRSQ